MSDLAATNCGCGCDGGMRSSCGNNSCWILILLLLFCNNGSGSCGMNSNGCGFGGDSCWILILLLLFCNNGSGFGIGCNNDCGCTSSCNSSCGC